MTISRHTTDPTDPVRARARRAAALAALMSAGVLLVGCASGSSAGDAVAPAPAQEQAVGGAVAPEAVAPQADAGRGVVPGSDAAGTDAGTVLDADRDLIVTATTTVRTDDVLTATARALDVARGYDAVVVSQRTIAAEDVVPYPAVADTATCPPSDPGCAGVGAVSGYASSTITMRVEPASVDPLLAGLAELGTAVSVTRDVTDVTTEVADVDARVRTARASLDRVRVLLGRAENIGDIVALESELSTRQANLESLLAQQRALADATAMATVTAVLVDEQTPAVEEPQTGFLAGLARGWEAFVDAVVVGLTVLGAVLPFLLVALVVVVLVVVLVRRGGRRTATPVVRGPAPATPEYPAGAAAGPGPQGQDAR